MMRAIALLIVVSLIVLSAPVASGMTNYSMWLSAHPQAIVADGHSETTISAEVRDSNGNPVPDGTVVEFTTGLGIIEHNTRTIAGVARARLQSSTTIGTAMISAVAAGGLALSQMRIDFLEPGTELFDESFISISSKKYLGYDTSTKLVDSAGGVEIFSRGLTINAEAAQVDVAKNILRATARLGGDDIIIQRGDKKVLASAFYYDFNSMNGVILTPAGEGAKRMLFRGRDMFTQPDKEPERNATFNFIPVTESAMFIRCHSLIIRPGEEVKFKQAAFYMDGSRVLSVPLHVEPLRGGQNSGIGRVLTYGTDGLRLDLPMYYSLTPNGTGAIRLKHSEPGQWGYYSGQTGWQVDLEQEYNSGGNTEGMFSLNRISSQWGMRWNQRTEFDNNSSLYTFVDFPNHQALFANSNYSRSFKDYTMTLYMRGDKQQNMLGRYSTSALLQSRPKPLLSGALSYSFSNRTSFDSGVLNSSKVGDEVGMQLFGKPLMLGGTRGCINTSLLATHGWGGGTLGTQVYGNASYARSLGNVGQMGLNYSYSFTDSTGYANHEHRLSMDLSMRSSKWGGSIYLTQGLNTGNLSAFGEVGYSFLPTWRVHLLGTLQRSSGSLSSYSYSDAEIALAKIIGRQEARLIWSQQLKRFRVEFSALSF